MTISIQALADGDLNTANTILNLAFRTSTSRLQDLRLYREVEPDGCFLAVQNGHPIGMAAATSYGAFAYIGLMAVDPKAQRQGVGSALMRFLLARLDQRHVPLVLLDASQVGRPLYGRLGFVAYDETLVFQRTGDFPNLDRPPHVQSISVRDLDELVRWDATVFGADRRKVLQALLAALPERAFILRDDAGQVSGYLFAQASRIGPWVMRESYDAEALLQAALALPYEDAVSVVVPAENREATGLLRRYGFERVRTNLHMGRGSGEPPGHRDKVYAQTSLALG